MRQHKTYQLAVCCGINLQASVRQRVWNIAGVRVARIVHARVRVRRPENGTIRADLAMVAAIMIVARAYNHAARVIAGTVTAAAGNRAALALDANSCVFMVARQAIAAYRLSLIILTFPKIIHALGVSGTGIDGPAAPVSVVHVSICAILTSIARVLLVTCARDPAARVVSELENGDFEGGFDYWWGSDTVSATMAVVDGELCATAPAGLENVWDAMIGQGASCHAKFFLQIFPS